MSGGILSTLVLDASGDRTNLTTNGVPTTYATANNLNQYPSVGGLGATYDGNGNLKTYHGWTYVCDAMNRLTSASKGMTSVSFYYDGLNRQVARIVTGVATYSVYDGWALIAEYSNGSNTASRAWVYGAAGMIKELVSGNYYYQDGLGSTSHLAANDGTLLEWYRYDLQGAPFFYDPGNNQLGTSNYGINHLYTGQRWHGELGLYDLRNRYYSPDLGRFLQPDPIGFQGDPSNLYRYTGNNPVNRSDPSGLNWFASLLRSISGFFHGSSSSSSNPTSSSNPGSSGNPDGSNGERIIVTGQDILEPNNNRSGLTSLGGNGWVNGNSPQGILGLPDLPFSGGGGGGFNTSIAFHSLPPSPSSPSHAGHTIAPRANFSLGVVQWTFSGVFSTADGSFSTQFSMGFGFTPSVSLTGGVTITNADSAATLEGWGKEAGVAAGLGPTGEANVVWGNGYQGVDLGFGYGFGSPVSPQFFMNHTDPSVYYINDPSGGH